MSDVIVSTKPVFLKFRFTGSAVR